MPHLSGPIIFSLESLQEAYTFRYLSW